MLSNNDAQLFYKLMDSTSSSLKELAVKCEVLVRSCDANSRVVSELSKDVGNVDHGVDSIEKTIDKCNASMVEMRSVLDKIVGAGAISTERQEEIGRQLKHIDDQIDVHGRSLAELGGKLSEVGGTTLEIKGIRNDLEPVVGLSKALKTPLEAAKTYLKKPVTILLAIYVLLASVIAFTKATVWLWQTIPRISVDITDPGKAGPPAQTNATTNVKAKTP